MKIVRFKSGLGNQMFQYAFYKSLKSAGNNVKADLSSFNEKENTINYQLKEIFGIEVDELKEKEIKQYNKLYDNSNCIFSKLRRRLLGNKKTHFKEVEFRYNLEYMKIPNVVLDGYWQDIRYFNDISEKVANDFKFDLHEINKNNKNTNILQQIQNSNSVSIHVRRGDYINEKYYEKFGSVCSLDYYKEAIKIITNKYKNISFFIFSNDIKWCKDNFDIEGCTYIDWNIKQYSYIDMYLMSQCKGNILANSSFSWWAGFLNKNINKTIICPSPWFFDENCNEFSVALKSWIKVKVPISK